MNKTIEIIVSPTGETRLEAKGFAGGECKEASKFVKEALGTQVAEANTSEFNSISETTSLIRASE